MVSWFILRLPLDLTGGGDQSVDGEAGEGGPGEERERSGEH